MSETAPEQDVDPKAELVISEEIGVDEASTHYEIGDVSQTGE